jgi:glutamate racemase
MVEKITKTGMVRYLTTENPDKFKESAQVFLHEQVEVERVSFD